jgi:hypothetical protein
MEQTNQTNPLVSAVVSAFDAYIMALVDKRVSEIMQTQAALHAINEETIKRIETLVNDAIEVAIDEHNDREDHPSQDSITQEIDDCVTNAINYFDFDDKVRECVRNLTFSVEVD